MKTITCDRCRTEIEQRPAYRLEVTSGYDGEDDREILTDGDLCPTCYLMLKAWIASSNTTSAPAPTTLTGGISFNPVTQRYDVR